MVTHNIREASFLLILLAKLKKTNEGDFNKREGFEVDAVSKSLCETNKPFLIFGLSKNQARYCCCWISPCIQVSLCVLQSEKDLLSDLLKRLCKLKHQRRCWWIRAHRRSCAPTKPHIFVRTNILHLWLPSRSPQTPWGPPAASWT